MEPQRQSLEVLLAQPGRAESECSPQEWKVEQELEALRNHLKELASGLVESKYWELVAMVLVDGLESAKGALESVATDDTRLRVCQGEAKAYRSAYNTIIEMSRDVSEEANG
jgi:hypothetical protein